MNKKKTAVRLATVALSSVMVFGAFGFLTGCKKKVERLIVMSEPMDGLFNPFYSTSAPDMDVVGMTQLSMLSTDKDGKIAYGEDEPTVVLDYKQEFNENEGSEGVTTYYFVLKNGIKYSDGMPLTMNDVLFNMYVYLDPVYTGSTTMYSTDIVGLKKYRTQKISSDGAGSEDDSINTQANTFAFNRILELTTLYETTNRINNPNSNSYDVTEQEMRDAIADYSAFTPGYKEAVSKDELTVEEYRKQLLEDYELTLETFKKELESDYNSAIDSFKESSPYKEWDAKAGTQHKFSDPVFSFMYMEGYVEVKYTDNTRTEIQSVNPQYNDKTIIDKDKAIEHVFRDKINTELNGILSYYATANTIRTDYIAKATEIILHKQAGITEEGQLVVAPNIEGIVSMGHSTNDTAVSINGKNYTIAKEHKSTGEVANAGEYDVLRIKINGKDPKAIWNFGFTVAPHHYYSDTTKYPVDITANKFGVNWGSFDFMRDVIQGVNSYGARKNHIPVGAGAYMATDMDNNDKPAGNAFNNNNFVYFKANDGFLLGEPKIKNIAYQVLSASNALDQLERGSVHYVTPQFTKANKEKIDNELKDKGIESVATWQLGYGYIGVNAGLVPNINIRKAIMSAMDISQSISYYSSNTVVNIHWPMSIVSWAYPTTDGKPVNTNSPADNMLKLNGHDYMQYTGEADAKQKIRDYMALAGVSAGAKDLKIKFTIAGSNLTDHPVYAVFNLAAKLLNDCGWDVSVVPDTNALTKLSTGSLAVWAAAWGSTIDPDMYQVYHKNSTATSVYSWGYREILASPGLYQTEPEILNLLSEKIDEGRKTLDEKERADIYKVAMGYVLDLAVEMPVYQRQTLYAYNANVIDTKTFPEQINSYSSPLGKIWEIDFKK